MDDYTVQNIRESIKDDSTRQQMLKRTNGRLSQIAMELYGPGQSFLSDSKDTLTNSIVNFRPGMYCGNKLPLYLTKEYKNILNVFLGNAHAPLGNGGLMSPARSIGESEKRKKFLERYIRIWYGHWGGYWQLHSYPTALSITFDKDMMYARIDFRMVYEGGEAILKRDKDTWVLVSARRTWIE